MYSKKRDTMYRGSCEWTQQCWHNIWSHEHDSVPQTFIHLTIQSFAYVHKTLRFSKHNKVT